MALQATKRKHIWLRLFLRKFLNGRCLAVETIVKSIKPEHELKG